MKAFLKTVLALLLAAALLLSFGCHKDSEPAAETPATEAPKGETPDQSTVMPSIGRSK